MFIDISVSNRQDLFVFFKTGYVLKLRHGSCIFTVMKDVDDNAFDEIITDVMS